MLNVTPAGYNEFSDNCPKTLGRTPWCSDITEIKDKTVEALGQEYLKITEQQLSVLNVGPYPSCLASYINEKQDSYIATANTFVNTNELESHIIAELSEARPLIVMIQSGAQLHYQVLTAYDDETKIFTVFDTNNSQSTISLEDLEKKMSTDDIITTIQGAMALSIFGHSFDKKSKVPTVLKHFLEVHFPTVKDLLEGYNIISFRSAVQEASDL